MNWLGYHVIWLKVKVTMETSFLEVWNRDGGAAGESAEAECGERERGGARIPKIKFVWQLRL